MKQFIRRWLGIENNNISQYDDYIKAVVKASMEEEKKEVLNAVRTVVKEENEITLRDVKDLVDDKIALFQEHVSQSVVAWVNKRAEDLGLKATRPAEEDEE